MADVAKENFICSMLLLLGRFDFSYVTSHWDGSLLRVLIGSKWGPCLPQITKNIKWGEHWSVFWFGWTLDKDVFCQQIFSKFLPHNLLRNIYLCPQNLESGGIILYFHDLHRQKGSLLTPQSCFHPKWEAIIKEFFLDLPLSQEVTWSILSFYKWDTEAQTTEMIGQGRKPGIRTQVSDFESRILLLLYFVFLWWYCLAWIHRSDHFCLNLYFASFSVPCNMPQVAFCVGWLPGFARPWHSNIYSKDVSFLLAQNPYDHS